MARRLKGVALEEGANTAHAAIVARALGIPMVGSLHGLLSRVEDGDRVVLDGERGEARLRPEQAFVAHLQAAHQSALGARGRVRAAAATSRRSRRTASG